MKPRHFAWGVVWALLITALETLTLPPQLFTGNLFMWWLTNWLLPVWCVIGSLYVWAAEIGDRRAGTTGVVISWLLVGVVGAVVQPLSNVLSRQLLATRVAGFYEFATPVGQPSSTTESLIVFNLWIALFYGGLLVAAYTLTARRDRLDDLRMRAALVRSRTEAQLATMRVEALESRLVAPLLLRSLGELERRYRDTPARAEVLLDRLVELLRAVQATATERLNAYDRLKREVET